MNFKKIYISYRPIFLVLPTFIFFLVFFIIPVASLFIIAFDKPVTGVLALQGEWTLKSFLRIWNRSLYFDAAVMSLTLAALVSIITLIIGYPLAYLIAKTENVARNTFLMILVLCAMQLDMVIRLFGLMVLLGDNGVINGALMYFDIIEKPIGLMYNKLGVVIGLVQFSLPFMILSLIGIIRGISPSVVEASRSLGASPNKTFWNIILPLSMPGILAGTLLVFAISISSYLVPALMGGWKVMMMPLHVYQQVAEMGKWQFGSAIAVVLFLTSLLSVLIYQKTAIRIAGGRA
ncbi:MAG: Putrescine transport system permease protein PotH [Alphaproteobacteria bacterium MarineAlpha5_Bin9]|nr:MAG: Putrescine transport system permease protein PotH [Alphaproteobacteria bacterium MarineAlpha5_Bin9]|tara:strand:+ start:8474 stop:9346 length:873 start_codon:yes stop_codon:yes gene_type:complete